MRILWDSVPCYVQLANNNSFNVYVCRVIGCCWEAGEALKPQPSNHPGTESEAGTDAAATAHPYPVYEDMMELCL